MAAAAPTGSAGLRFTPRAYGPAASGSENSPLSRLVMPAAGLMICTVAAPFGGATVQIISPAAGITSLESGEFSLPLAAGPYALGVNLSPALPVGAAAAMTAQLSGYN